MSDAQNIEKAYRLIEYYIGEGEKPANITELLLDVAAHGNKWTRREFHKVGHWAIERAWKQYLACL